MIRELFDDLFRARDQEPKRARTHDVVLLGVERLEERGGSPSRSEDDDVLLAGVLGELLSGRLGEISG